MHLNTTEVSELDALIDALQAGADAASMQGRPQLATLLAGTRQALRGVLTKALQMQETLQVTDAILSPPVPDGVAASQLS